MAGPIAGLTGVADTSVVNLNADLVGLGGSDLDILDGERLAGSPGNGSLNNKTAQLDFSS
jgi:hypothetical protein